MQNKLFWFLFVFPFVVSSQISINGVILDQKTNEPLPFATIKTNDYNYALSSSKGEFMIRCSSYPVNLQVSYLGYNTATISINSEKEKRTKIYLSRKQENLAAVTLAKENKASKIIQKAIEKKNVNNPQKSLNSYQYRSYNKFKITEDNQATLETPDTTNVEIEKIFNKAHSFLSEKVSLQQFTTKSGEKETVLATRMSGFKKPVYDVLGIEIQSNSFYEENYTIFNTRYAGPLSKRALKNYYYKILDTIAGTRPSLMILFQPRRSKAVASLEGVLYLDIETLAIQKAIAEVRGELNIVATHDFKYYENEKIWFPTQQQVTIKPGEGKQKVSLFGGKITTGSIDKESKTKNNDFLISQTDLFDIELNPSIDLKQKQAAINITPEAIERLETYWQQYRTKEITEKDKASFKVVDSIVAAQKIERKINVIQNFNIGYYPAGFFDFDLTYPLKYNNYEGLRLGLGGSTNEKISDRFRIEGYLAYGFRDDEFKYGLGGGVLLNKKNGSWININYTDDISEVGSFTYLTDRRAYSLFEPRLVNIDFYYRHKTWSTSLQHQITPKLLSETQIAVSDIDQTGGYIYLNDGNSFSSYKTFESTIALRWTPFSKYLKTPNGINEIYDGYPKITAQYSQGFSGVFESNFNYSKIGIKTEYTIKRLNQSSTSFLIEADIATGDIPLTHLYHAYPNAPTKETVLQRFSVAGRKSFETMFFNEFFSNRLATLQIKHRLRPLEISSWIKPELVFVSKYAIGDVDNKEDHLGVSFNSLNQGYQESGFEINQLFAGFGLSFAYRYGAYHLPEFTDNLSFKFTFYLQL